MAVPTQRLQVRGVKGIAASVDWLDVIDFQPAGKFAAHASVTVPNQDSTAQPRPVAGRYPPMMLTHAVPFTTTCRNRPARRGARDNAPAARTKLTATSSRLVLFAPPRLIILVLPDVSFSTIAAARLAVSSPRLAGSTPRSPSSASRRSAEISCVLSDQRDTRGNSRIPGAASRSSGRRNRSQTIDSGFHSRTSETRSPTSGTRRPVATRSTPAETSRAYVLGGTRSRRSCSTMDGTPGAIATDSHRPFRQIAVAADHARPPPRSSPASGRAVTWRYSPLAHRFPISGCQKHARFVGRRPVHPVRHKPRA